MGQWKLFSRKSFFPGKCIFSRFSTFYFLNRFSIPYSFKGPGYFIHLYRTSYSPQKNEKHTYEVSIQIFVNRMDYKHL